VAVSPLEGAQRVAKVAAGHGRRRDNAALAAPGCKIRKVRRNGHVDAALRALGEECVGARGRDGDAAREAAKARCRAALLPAHEVAADEVAPAALVFPAIREGRREEDRAAARAQPSGWAGAARANPSG
jgi:hypothetical protein